MSTTSTLKVGEYISAAVLKTLDIPYLGTEPAGRRCLFLFDDAGGRATAILRHHENGGTEVNSARMAAELNFLKSAMWSVKNRPTDFQSRSENYYGRNSR